MYKNTPSAIITTKNKMNKSHCHQLIELKNDSSEGLGAGVVGSLVFCVVNVVVFAVVVVFGDGVDSDELEAPESFGLVITVSPLTLQVHK